MADIISIFSKKKGSNEKLMLDMSDDIDAVVKKWLMNPQIRVSDLAGVISHRLASLLLLVDKKQALWDVCISIITRKAIVK